MWLTGRLQQLEEQFERLSKQFSSLQDRVKDLENENRDLNLLLKEFDIFRGCGNCEHKECCPIEKEGHIKCDMMRAPFSPKVSWCEGKHWKLEKKE